MEATILRGLAGLVKWAKRILKIEISSTGYMDVNGKRFYPLQTAITANSTVTTSPIGSIGWTIHATGKNKIFVSDGTKWQEFAVLAITPGTHIAALQENAGAIGGTNDGNLPNLTATVGSDIAAFTDPPSAAEMTALRTFVNAIKADNANLRAGIRENAAKTNALITSLEGNTILAGS